MGAFFTLELDTTAPIAEIHAPEYTSRADATVITVTANELLCTYQEVYLIDSEGTKHDVTFLYNDESFHGELYLNDYPFGLTTVYARVKDEVDNVSNLVSKTFRIFSDSVVHMKLDVKTRINHLDIRNFARNVEVKSHINDVQVNLEVM